MVDGGPFLPAWPAVVTEVVSAESATTLDPAPANHMGIYRVRTE